MSYYNNNSPNSKVCKDAPIILLFMNHVRTRAQIIGVDFKSSFNFFWGEIVCIPVLIEQLLCMINAVEVLMYHFEDTMIKRTVFEISSIRCQYDKQFLFDA